MNDQLIWIDLEMTGLDVERHVIVEIASIITDNQLNIIEEGPDIVVNQAGSTLAFMDEWSRKQHQSTGLLDRVKASTCDCRHAEQQTLSFLSRHCRKGQAPLCGNSVWQDRRFLMKYMPGLEALFHYRDIDVSSFKEVVKRWFPSLPRFEKRGTHLAMNDIKESIEELKYYREKVFLNL